jgi:HxlR-like helix-turn-helix
VRTFAEITNDAVPSAVTAPPWRPDADRIIDRLDFKEIPPKVEYSLTAFGETLAKALAPLCVWGTEHMREVETLMSHRQISEDEDAA